MKRLLTLFVLFFLIATSVWAIPPAPPSGSGVQTDTNCNQAKYFTLGVLCQDTDDGKLYKGTGAQVVEIAQGTTGDVATDAIWDAAGDLVQGTGANTGAKLTKGAEGKLLRAGAASVAWSTATFADTYAKGTFLYNAAANTVASLAHPGAANYILTTNAADTSAWLASSANMISLLGSADYATARTNLGLGTMATATATSYIAKALLTEQGDIIYASGASTPAALPHGAANSTLLSGGNAANPAWSAYTFAAPGAVGAVLSSDGTNWIRSTSLSITSISSGVKWVDATVATKALQYDLSGMTATKTATHVQSCANDCTITYPTATATLLYSGGALGTPASGTLTNATGLPIAGIESLGTGVGTALAVNVGAAGAPLIQTAPAAIDGHTDATAITAAQMSDPRCNIYNTGQGSGDVTLTLPAAAASLSCLFTVGTTVASNKWRVRAASGDKIYNMAADGTPTAGSDNGYVGYSTTAKYPVIGNAFACVSFKTDNYDWICKPVGNIVLTTE